MARSKKVAVGQMQRKVLILSNGPIPTPEHTRVEGGGLRCWGLAKGIVQNESNVDVTVAYHESYIVDGFTAEHEGIHILTWNIDTIAGMLQDYESVLVSYCMGELSVRVADNISPNQQLILDCYVPIYVEVSARQSEQVKEEYAAFQQDVGRWAHVLRRGDVFLCASEPQKRYYQGVLSAIGRVNPLTYNQENILIVPYGIYRDEPVANSQPISRIISDSSIKKVLWFGGIYPWFDLRELLAAVKLANDSVPMKLIIVGAKNPFNNHPDFTKKHDELVAFIASNQELQDLVIMQDWVSFDERADWYLDSDIVVVVNKIGDENELAWRTRLIDFVWSGLPILTNGGDPLGEKLIAAGAAEKLDGLESKDIAAHLIKALSQKSSLIQLKKNTDKIKHELYWDVVTSKLSKFILQHTKSIDLEQDGQFSIIANHGATQHPVRRIARKATMLPSYAKNHGVKLTYLTVKSLAREKIVKITRDTRQPKIHFIAHQLDNSGAPFVFIDLVRELTAQTAKNNIDFHTFNPIHMDNINNLNKLGIKPKIYMSKEVGLSFVKGDVVVLNTVAHSRTLTDSIFMALNAGVVSKLIWYIHEDEPELIFDKKDTQIIKALMKKEKIIIYTAAKKTVDNYQAYFETTSQVVLQSYKYKIPEKFQRTLPAKQFDSLSFCLPGAVADGRKGQLPVFYAFKAFYEQYYKANPDVYRDFELVYIGMSEDFLSRQLQLHANALGKRFKHHGKVTHERCLEIVHESNMTICYSMRECLPLFVFEGMAAGHPVLRNDSSGMEEQLQEGVNGYMIQTDDYDQMIQVIEKVLNKQTTSNELLAKMSVQSHKIALAQENNTYQPIISSIVDAYERRIG